MSICNETVIYLGLKGFCFLNHELEQRTRKRCKLFIVGGRIDGEVGSLYQPENDGVFLSDQCLSHFVKRQIITVGVCCSCHFNELKELSSKSKATWDWDWDWDEMYKVVPFSQGFSRQQTESQKYQKESETNEPSEIGNFAYCLLDERALIVVGFLTARKTKQNEGGWGPVRCSHGNVGLLLLSVSSAWVSSITCRDVIVWRLSAADGKRDPHSDHAVHLILTVRYVIDR